MIAACSVDPPDVLDIDVSQQKGIAFVFPQLIFLPYFIIYPVCYHMHTKTSARNDVTTHHLPKNVYAEIKLSSKFIFLVFMKL